MFKGILFMIKTLLSLNNLIIVIEGFRNLAFFELNIQQESKLNYFTKLSKHNKTDYQFLSLVPFLSSPD